MRLLFLLLIFCSLANRGSAQIELTTDSVALTKSNNDRLKNTLPEITGLSLGGLQFEALLLPELPVLNKKLLDFHQNQQLKTYTGYSLNPFGVSTFRNPFSTNEAVFSAGRYQFSDRFSIGGSSFGAQTIYDPPVLNPQLNDLNLRGASLFMQYKISDKVKIETRVSVINHTPPIFP